MNTLIGLVALLSSAVPSNIQTPTWASGYMSARETVTSAHKPMAVFFGKGAGAWDKVVVEGSFDPAINQMLAAKYVCVYVDTTTVDGYNLAKTFEVSGKGLVISDATGKNQAFSLSGDMTKAELKDKLVRYSAADAKVATTETVVRSTEVMTSPVAPATYTFAPTSNCPNGNCPTAVSYPAAQYYQPAQGRSYYQPAGNCPNGKCPNAR